MRKMLMTALLATALAACGQSAQAPSASGAQPTPQATAAPAPSATSGSAPGAAPSASAPAPSPQATPASGLSVRPPDALVTAAKQQLAAFLKLQPDQLVLQSANQQEWPNSALGCPKEGIAYAEVLTEGFLLVFTDPTQTQRYEIHTPMEPTQLILCQGGQPIELAALQGTTPAAASPGGDTAVSDAAQRAADLARAALATQLGVNAESITLVSAEPTEWNDSSLGCSKPDQVYMQVITPGYRITLEAQGQRYEYHTDNGTRVVSC